MLRRHRPDALRELAQLGQEVCRGILDTTPRLLLVAGYALQLHAETVADLLYLAARHGHALDKTAHLRSEDFLEMLAPCALGHLKQIEYMVEVEHVLDQAQRVGARHLRHLRLVGRQNLLRVEIRVDGVVALDRRFRQGAFEHKPLERAASRQGHVGLPVGECQRGVDDGAVERQALALVDGYGPGRLEGNLAEHAVDLAHHLVALGLDDEADVLPLKRRDLYLLACVDGRHPHPFVGNGGHNAHHAVEELSVPTRVVLEKHHLRPLLEQKLGVGRIHALGEIALDLGVEHVWLAFKLPHPHGVDVGGETVVGGEPHISLLVGRVEPGDAARVEPCQRVVVEPVLPHGVEQVEESGVALAVDSCQLDRDVVEFREGVRVEEIWRAVVLGHDLALRLDHHGGQLLEVADQQQLHAAERLVRTADAAQGVVDGVEQVGADHRHLVDHQQVEPADDLQLILAESHLLTFASHPGHERSEVELEERVQRHAAGVDGGDSRGGGHHHALAARRLQVAQECGLSRAGASGQEEAPARLLDNSAGEVELAVGFHQARVQGVSLR